MANLQRFSEEELARALKRLSAKGQLAFALSCSERLYPNYTAFHREQGWGDVRALRSALDAGWSALEGRSIGADEVTGLREKVQAAEPETEDFDTILVSSALDASAAAGLVLRLLTDPSVSTVIEIASLCRDTVDMFVQDQEGLVPSLPDFEERIVQHRLMQTELSRQQRDIARLAGFSGASDEVARLRSEWRDPERSSIEQARDAPR